MRLVRLAMMAAFAFASVVGSDASAHYVPDDDVFDSSPGVEQGEEDMVLRAKIEGEAFALGDKCFLNGDASREWEVRALKGNPDGPFQKVDVGFDQWYWSHQLVFDGPEIETVQVARANTIDPRAMEATMRDSIMAELAGAGVDVAALQKAMAAKKLAASANKPPPGIAAARKKPTRAELEALLASLPPDPEE